MKLSDDLEGISPIVHRLGLMPISNRLTSTEAVAHQKSLEGQRLGVVERPPLTPEVRGQDPLLMALKRKGCTIEPDSLIDRDSFYHKDDRHIGVEVPGQDHPGGRSKWDRAEIVDVFHPFPVP